MKVKRRIKRFLRQVTLILALPIISLTGHADAESRGGTGRTRRRGQHRPKAGKKDI